MNWDDLRVARAVFRAGSFSSAARSLSINETTVARRLERLQTDLGFTLFEAIDGVRTPTARCEELLSGAEAMAGQADRIMQLADTDSGYTERRRIAATDSIAAEILAPNAASFLSNHPELELEFLASTENVDFSRWGADLAIRLKRPEKGNFMISRLVDLDLYFVEPAESLEAETILCAYPSDLDSTPESQYLRTLEAHTSARILSKNLLVIKRMVATGNCSAVLPGFMCGDLFSTPEYRLRKLEERRGVWLLAQRHLRNDQATRAVIDWIKDCFESCQP